MVQYEYRNYFPDIAYWDTRDPLGEAGGLNLYAFVGNNPVNWVDPWGLRTITSPINSSVNDLPVGPEIGALGGGLAGTGVVAWLYELFSHPMSNEATTDGDDGCDIPEEITGMTPHGEDRKEEARDGDTHRQIGDPNRIVREGRTFIDTETGNIITVNGDKVVVRGKDGKHISQFKNTRSNTQRRIQSGRWVPLY